MTRTRRNNGPPATATLPARLGSPTSWARVLGRYLLCDAIASGGMATVHLGRLVGAEGFTRTVAIKQLHQHFARSQEFVAMFLDEARILSRIRHPHVVAPLDVLVLDGDLFIVMEYVHGASLSELLDACAGPVPPRIASAIVVQMLLGLHAAHEATSEAGEPLSIVHRDISPHNVLVGGDGIARVADFGIAKAESRARTTGDGRLKGKLGYMAPEQLRSGPVDRRTDLFACGIVLWEALTGERLYAADNIVALFDKVENKTIRPPSELRPELPSAVDGVVRRALALDPTQRTTTAREMALELERAVAPASTLEISEWVEALVGSRLRLRADRISELESVDISALTLAASASNPPAGVQATALPVSATSNTVAAGVPATLAAVGVDRTAALPLKVGSPGTATTTFQAVTAAPSAAGRGHVEYVGAGTPRGASSRRFRRALWVVAPLAFCAVSAGAYWGRRSGHAANESPRVRSAAVLSAHASSLGESASADTSLSLPPPLEAPRAVTVETPAPVASVAAPRVSVGIHHASTAAGATRAAPPRPSASAALPAAPTSSAASATVRSGGLQRKCAVPYFVDEHGVKRFKPECF